MKNNLYFLSFCLLIFFNWTCQKSEIQPTEVCQLSFIDSSATHPKGMIYQRLLDEYTQKGLPGISLIIRDADGQWLGGSGMADIEKNIPFEPCHVSKVASITKIFMGTLVMQLVEEEILALDDPITDYLPAETIEKVANAQQVTIRQLLNHTSGIYDLIDDSEFYLAILNNPGKKWEPGDLLVFTYGDPALFSPGEDVEYSNTNFLLMAMVIDAATGQSHAKLLRDRILDPLQLEDSYYHWHEALPSHVAQGYFDLYGNNTILEMSNFNTGSGNGYGGLYATVYDLKIFIEALLRDQTLLSPDALVEMLKITSEDLTQGEAYGVSIRKDFLEREENEYGLGHRGRDLAYTGDLFYFPEQDITMAYLINYGTDASSDLREVFFDFRNAIVDALMGN